MSRTIYPVGIKEFKFKPISHILPKQIKLDLWNPMKNTMF